MKQKNHSPIMKIVISLAIWISGLIFGMAFSYALNIISNI